MILAAGLGTRLLPFTRTKPKPLFTLGGRPLLDILIRNLRDAGFGAVLINTHHRSEMIADFIENQPYDIPVWLRHEPRILGTGGAIKNVQDLWDNHPLLIVNGDIFTNIDFKRVYNHHLAHDRCVTMVLHDCEPLNNVSVDARNRITGFHPSKAQPPGSSRLAFTGIHVLNREVLDFIPANTCIGIIEVYEELIRQGRIIGALTVSKHYWHDIGTRSGYQKAATEAIARKTLAAIGQSTLSENPIWSSLKGDGSDRTWHRVSAGAQSIIVAGHGLSPQAEVCEADSFWAIGRHLEAKGIPVPHMYDFDRPAGVIAVEDLGDCHFQDIVSAQSNKNRVVSLYKPVIDILVTMGVAGAEDFDTRWTYQTPYYDRQVILEKECDYFLHQFLNGVAGLDVAPETLQADFALLSDRGLSSGYVGFLHRDFQSRNILVHQDQCYVIDFQGGRLGPLAYDLAALLIDPYVSLSHEVEEALLSCYIKRLSSHRFVEPEAFRNTYRYCAINRNLQILGAFGFLSRVKGKRQFKVYIPAAVESLKYSLSRIEPEACKNLKALVTGL